MNKKMKASVTVFALIMLGMVIGMFLMGYTSMMFQFLGSDIFEGDEDGTGIESLTVDDLYRNIIDTLTSPAGLMILGVGGVFALISGLAMVGYAGGTILSFVLPVMLLFVFANIFFFPLFDYAIAEGLPSMISIILTVVFNFLLMLTVVTFATGRD